MTVYLLPEEPFFPPVDKAEPDGLVAIGGDLSAERVLQAYAHGIFPWFKDHEDIFWYSPDPRMILFPEQFKVSDSLNRIIKRNQFAVKFDTAFTQVIHACAAAPRQGQDGTWISQDFIDAYTTLHHRGYAHSVEVFYRDELVGGLYGVSLGAAFFGESMFYSMKNTSKVAFHALVERCRHYGFKFIDCQVETSHLLGLGASLVDRNQYLLLPSMAHGQISCKDRSINPQFFPDLFRDRIFMDHDVHRL
ncbi:MAG: leucyl/phenylalanyl-tRNA--protein transferase [Bacteroidetes bacterium]|nr:leucyl/phenylalanyl-tRNA--protein transferase [Bacteroidota bacterium]